jgi:hypothetical protein
MTRQRTLSKSAIKKILLANNLPISEDFKSGRTFTVSGKAQHIGMSSEGFHIEVLKLTAKIVVYVNYCFSTSSHPTATDYERKSTIEEQAFAAIEATFTKDIDNRGRTCFVQDI